MIKKVTEKDDFKTLAKLLNDSFITVANDFGITKENCPFHNAFIDNETLKSKLISTGKKIFDHLPFNVCFMDKRLNSKLI